MAGALYQATKTRKYIETHADGNKYGKISKPASSTLPSSRVENTKVMNRYFFLVCPKARDVTIQNTF